MNKIKNTYENTIKTLEDRAFMYENEAVEYYKNVIINNKTGIMYRLQSAIRTHPSYSVFKIPIASFYSMDSTNETHDDSLSEPLFGNLETGYANMYNIWKYTNFQTRLMHHLGLNSDNYSIDLETEKQTIFMENNCYYNIIVLIYKPSL